MDKENAKRAFLTFSEVYKTGIPKVNLDGELIKKDGKKVFVEASVSLIKDSVGHSTGFRGIVHDIMERKRMEEEIFTLSITDHLTGLYNRRGFMTLADQQLKINKRTKKGLLLLFADLDNTKSINDDLGHEKGDKAIAEVAVILKEVFRKSDIVARMGGDEFAALGIESTKQDFSILENRLQHQIDIHNSIEDKDYRISLSIGMAYSDPEKPSSIDELISRADALMYEQKRGKRLSA
jgi:diguanylate cyclase (GGDEF)-like protein